MPGIVTVTAPPLSTKLSTTANAKAELNVTDLYVRGGEYEYRHGVNIRAIISLALGIAVALLGLVLPAARWLYDYAWFVGFAIAFVAYLAGRKLTALAPPAVAIDPQPALK